MASTSHVHTHRQTDMHLAYRTTSCNIMQHHAHSCMCIQASIDFYSILWLQVPFRVLVFFTPWSLQFKAPSKVREISLFVCQIKSVWNISNFGSGCASPAFWFLLRIVVHKLLKQWCHSHRGALTGLPEGCIDLVTPHAFQSDSSGFYRIPPDSTGLHQTQCLVGHQTKFPDWTGFSVQSDSTRLKVQSSPVESTGFYQN